MSFEDKWLNNFVKFSHELLKENQVVHEPFMLTSLNQEEHQVSCHCFYASVLFTPKFVLVFSNEAGGMCPMDMDHLIKAYPQIPEFNFQEELNKLKNQTKEENNES